VDAPNAKSYPTEVDVNDDEASPEEKCARLGARVMGARATLAFCQHTGIQGMKCSQINEIHEK
jgi:hypothetical protein